MSLPPLQAGQQVRLSLEGHCDLTLTVTQAFQLLCGGSSWIPAP